MTKYGLPAVAGDPSLHPELPHASLFTATPDLVSEFPAHAARVYGWDDVPLLCAQELAVPGSLPRCVRVMLHVETSRARNEMKHAYLRDAVLLRKDLLSD